MGPKEAGSGVTYVAPAYTWTPSSQHDKCELHPGVRWNGGDPCFVCHPTGENLGTIEHRVSMVPDPTEYIRPGVNQCQVLCDPDHDNTRCGRPGSGRTILGFAICDDCYSSVRSI